MLMAELSTAVKNQLPVKVIVMRNDMLAEVVFEQKELGNPPYGCELGGIDFAQVATACERGRLALHAAPIATARARIDAQFAGHRATRSSRRSG
jgi:thiamine pyrophosphate-dependent acetolactate synthase large subunit-like protein